MSTIEDFQNKLSDPALVKNAITNGTEVQVSVTYKGKNGAPVTRDIMIVTEKPSDLALQAGEPLEAYSLSRVMKSEGYAGPASQKARALIAIGQTVQRVAHKSFSGSDFPITNLLTRSIFKIANGKYGQQTGRYAATSLDPKPWHIEAAKAIINNELPDVVPGAVSFLDPWLPGATQRGVPLGDFLAVMKKRHSLDKLAWTGPVPGIDTKSLIFFYSEPSKEIREERLADFMKYYRGLPREPSSSEEPQKPK